MCTKQSYSWFCVFYSGKKPVSEAPTKPNVGLSTRYARHCRVSYDETATASDPCSTISSSPVDDC